MLTWLEIEVCKELSITAAQTNHKLLIVHDTITMRESPLPLDIRNTSKLWTGIQNTNW